MSENQRTELEGRGAAEWRARLRRGRLARVICLLLAAYCLLLTSDGGAASARLHDGPGVVASSLLEVGAASKLAAESFPKTGTAAAATPAELRIVSYNIRYRSGEDLDELISLLKTDAEIGGAALIGLQEVDRSKKRTKFTNTARVLAEALGMHYVWAAPPNPEDDDGKKGDNKKGDSKKGGGKKAGGDEDDEDERREEETGVAILSRYPLSDVSRLVLAHEGPNGRRRAAVGATARVGSEDVRFYSVHAETRMPVEKKVAHWRTVLEDLERHPKIRRVVVLGDFNTIKGKDIRAARKLFTDAGFHTPFADDRATFRVFFLDFKLDWVWLRGLEAVEHGVDRKIGLSDHWPLWVRVKLAAQDAPAAGTQ